jgi:hypothetical protein
MDTSIVPKRLIHRHKCSHKVIAAVKEMQNEAEKINKKINELINRE